MQILYACNKTLVFKIYHIKHLFCSTFHSSPLTSLYFRIWWIEYIVWIFGVLHIASWSFYISYFCIFWKILLMHENRYKSFWIYITERRCKLNNAKYDVQRTRTWGYQWPWYESWIWRSFQCRIYARAINASSRIAIKKWNKCEISISSSSWGIIHISQSWNTWLE